MKALNVQQSRCIRLHQILHIPLSESAILGTYINPNPRRACRMLCTLEGEFMSRRDSAHIQTDIPAGIRTLPVMIANVELFCDFFLQQAVPISVALRWWVTADMTQFQAAAASLLGLHQTRKPVSQTRRALPVRPSPFLRPCLRLHLHLRYRHDERNLQRVPN